MEFINIPKPKIIKNNKGRVLWKYEFEHYIVRFNKFPGDEEVFACIKQIDLRYPNITEMHSYYYVDLPFGYFEVKDKEYVLQMVEEAFELAEFLENNMEVLCVPV